MRRVIKYVLALLGAILAAPSLSAAQSEKRIALVIGNAAYQQGALPTAANDAGLIRRATATTRRNALCRAASPRVRRPSLRVRAAATGARVLPAAP